MLETSSKANENYLAHIIQLKNLKKHSNADRLQTVSIKFQNVITGQDAKNGDVYVYFPVESKINSGFISRTNSFRDNTKNDDPDKTGFFDDNCRVRAVKLRGEKSMGYIVPLLSVFEWADVKINYTTWEKDRETYINQTFDVINGKKLLEKYIIVSSEKKKNIKQGKNAKLSKLVEGQTNFHVNTSNLRYNLFNLKPSDIVSLTYKTHGTSWWAANVLVKKQLNWFEKLLKYCNVNIIDKCYDIVYESRRVVKNKQFEDPKNKNHYYNYDLWKDICDKVKEHIPKGYTLYGECLGFTKDGGYIQKGYDYSCDKNKFKLEIYRISHTNPDGLVTELTYPQIVEFCENTGLIPSTLFYYGKLDELYPKIKGTKHWHKNLLRRLEKEFNEKDCFMCVNSVPEEGIVLRQESLFSCTPLKLKSWRFLERETAENDKGVENIEDNN